MLGGGVDSDPWSECSGKGCRQGRGGRRRRLLDQGMLRFVVLQELDREPCHGYELIKRLTERSGGIYSPSPGMIYPMLTMLEELGLVLVTESGNKRRYSLTDRGKDFLDENRALTQAVAERLEALAKDDWENMRRHLQGLRDAVHERVAVAHGQRQVVARLEEILENALKQVRNL